MYKLPATEVEPVRFRRVGARRVFRESGTATAAQIIGAIKPGDDICGITNGRLSLIDIAEHVLTQTGPADQAVEKGSRHRIASMIHCREGIRRATDARRGRSNG